MFVEQDILLLQVTVAPRVGRAGVLVGVFQHIDKYTYDVCLGHWSARLEDQGLGDIRQEKGLPWQLVPGQALAELLTGPPTALVRQLEGLKVDGERPACAFVCVCACACVCACHCVCASACVCVCARARDLLCACVCEPSRAHTHRRLQTKWIASDRSIQCTPTHAHTRRVTQRRASSTCAPPGPCVL